jgi:hypothetical protein
MFTFYRHKICLLIGSSLTNHINETLLANLDNGIRLSCFERAASR